MQREGTAFLCVLWLPWAQSERLPWAQSERAMEPRGERRAGRGQPARFLQEAVGAGTPCVGNPGNSHMGSVVRELFKHIRRI